MENKSNSLSRVKSHQREKVLRFSIRKYSFGAASVAVAALMFLGARVASADSVIENNSQPTTDVVKKKEKDKPLAELQQPTDIKVEVAQNPSEKKTTTNNENVIKVVDKAKLKKVVEELKTTLSSKSDLDKSVISPIKDRVQKGQVLLDSDTATQKDVDELLSLLESDLTALSNATKESSKVQETATENKTEIKDNKTASELSEADKTISDKKESLKLSADQLQAAVLELPEHESTKEVFEKANELLGLAQGVLENTTISLNDVEDMTKRVKRMFNSVKNATTRLTSGARDSRNGKSMGEGTQFRATTTDDGRVEGALTNVKEYISEARGQGSTTIGSRDRTISKTFMTAKYSEENGSKFITYDVYFQNDGRALDGATRNALWFYPPRDILYSDGSYPKGPVYEAYYERYRNNTGTGTLSHNPNNFTKVGDTYNVPLRNGQYEDSSSQRLWGESYSFFQLTAGPTRDNQRQEMLKNLKDNPELNSIIKQNNSYPGASYSHLLSIGANVNYAYKYHVKLRLKNNVTADEAKRAGVMAVTTKSGLASNATAAYVYAATGSRLVTKPDAQVYPIQGSTYTKVVGDSIPNSGNPVADRYITRKGSGDFPAGMSWSWEGNNSPSTVNAGKFTYTAIARYQDGTTSKDANSGSDGRVYFTVNPKKPTITTSVVNKKGLTNQTIEVNVGSGVKNGSVVKLYDGNRVIGQGTSNGTTARITVSGALPGNPLKAETTVDNGGVVVSQKSDPVTPTEAPDTQAPTLAITPANQTVVEGQTVTFTVTARDNKHVNLDANDFLKKYGTRVFSGKASIASPTDTDTEKIRRITITTTAEDVGKTNTITFNATDNANHRATPVTFTLTVTSRDKIAPTITAGNATVTSREQITPISVTAVDNTGGVGMRDNNPIEVTGLPTGLTYANNRITGTPTGAPGNSTVTIKAYDKNGNMATKTITITVRSQADAHNPTGTGLTVNQNHTITDAELKAKVSNYAPGTLSIVSRPSTATAGNAGNAVVKVTYPDGTFDTVNVPVTVTDVTGPTITADSATVTKNESITPIPVTAVDNTGGVGMRDNNPIEVTNLPAGLRYANNQITGTPTAGVGYYTVTIKAYDKNNRSTTKQIRITVRSQAEAHNPTGAGLTVNQNHTITDAELKAKVSNVGPGTLSIVSRPSTATAGNAGNAVVKVTYPDGTFDNVNVPVTVTDVTGPTITAESATVTKNESITPIPVTAVDNTGGVGMRDNNPIEVTNLPAGLRYANNQITGTPTAGVGYYTVTIKAYDKNNRSTTKQIRITVRSQAEAHNPTGETLTVPYNHNITDDEVKAKVQNFAPGTLTVQSKPSTNTSGNVGNAVVKVTYPDGSHDTVNVPVVVGRPNKDDYTPKYNDGNGKPGESVGIPVGEANGKTIPSGTTYTSGTPGLITVDDKGKVTVTIPSDKNPGDKVTGKVLVRYPDGSEEEVPVTVTVVNRDKDDYTPQYNDGNGKPGASVGIPVSEANGKTIPSGTTYTSGTPGLITVDDKGKVTVTIPSDKNPGDKVTGKVLVRYPDGSEEEVPVTVTVVNRDKDDYTPQYKDGNGKPGASVDIPVSEANGKTIPSGTTYTSGTPGLITVDDKGKVTVTIPSDKNPGDKVTGKVLVRYPDGSEEEVPVTVTVVNRDKDDYTPKYDDGNGKPGESVEIPVGEANGKTIPSGTTYTSGTPGLITVDDKGKVTVTIPSDKNPGDKVTGKVLVRYPDGSEEEVPVTVTVVNRDKDDYTPKYDDGTGKPGASVEIPVGEANGKTIPAGTTYTSKTPGVVTVDDKGKVTVTIPADKNPGDEVTGKVLVRYPDGSEEEVPVKVTVVNRDKDDYTPKYDDGNGKPGESVEIPVGEANGKTIPSGTTYTSKTPGVVTVDDKGKVTVTIPADKNPGDEVTGKVLVRYPDGSEEEVPVKVTVVNRDKDDYTPKYDDGNGKPGASVDIPVGEANGKTIPSGTTYTSKTPGLITVDDKGKVTVTIPADKNPGDEVTGKVLVRYPDGSEEEVPVKVTVTPPEKLTPTIELKPDPKTGDVTVTPKKPDGSTYPSGSKVVIPGENNTPIEVTIGDNGSGEVPNDKLPKKDVPGKGTVTEPNKKPSQPVDVTTPAQKTPTVDVEQDPKTGDVTVTPKKPDGSTFPPGTTVEIPGKDGKPIPVTIGEDGKGKVPNSDLPEGKVPGTGKITEPGKPAVEVPVTTPGKVTPATPTTETPSEIEITRKPNGDAVVTPMKPDGSTYPSGSKVVIPGENNTPIEVTIGDNGSGEVPNDKLPKKDVPGKGTVTEPNKKPSQPVDVTTPAQKTPTVDVEQDPKTGDVTVTPKKPDGSTFPPGTTVEIPGKDGKPIPVTIGEDGKGKVPNSDLPEGKVPGTGKITEPGKPAVEVPVTTPGKVTPATPTTETPSEIEITRKPNGDAVVTPKKPDGSTYPSGSKVVIPGENNTPIEVTIGDNGSGEVPNDKLPKKDVPGKGTVTEPNKKPSQPVDVTTPAQKTPTVDVEQDPKTGDVTVTPKKPDGSTFPPGTTVEIPGKDGKPIPVTIGEDGKGKVPNSDLPEGKVPGTGKITEPGKPAVEVPVTTPGKVTPATPTTETPSEIEITRKPNGDAVVTPKKPDGSTYPSGSKVVIPGENNTPIEVTIGDNGSGEVPNDKLPKKDVPGKGTVTEPNKKPSQPVDVTTPAQKTPTVDVEQDPKTGDVTVTPKKPDGSTFPPGTTVEIPGKDGKPIPVTIGEDGKGKVPNSDLPEGKVPGTGKITEPGKPAVEVPVTTPGKVTPATPTTETPSEIEITRKPNGDAVVTPMKPDGSTYPSGSKVVIPGENNTPIEVTIGDNGSGEVPNDKLPKKDVPGKGTVTEPNKKPSQPVDVTTPAQKTPTVDVEQDPKTGDVTVTPKKPDGSTFPPGTTVEIPGKDGKPIPVTIGEDGKGKVPNSDLPEGKVPGTGKITEPGKPAVEVPVTTPGKVTPATPTTETPSEIEITRKPNGDAVVTPKKPDGSTYPSGSKVVIPGENNTPIEVTIGDNGSGEVPNDKLPKKDVPGKGTVTEPNKKPSQPVDVTTPAQKTPTVDVEQDPKTGDVTVTPKKPDGSTFPPGTTVEIPGKDGKPIPVTIGEDGKGKVPNSDLPEGKVPGTGKITEPGKPAVEVPVTTPGKVTPATPTTETPSEIEITRKPNGDAVVTPKKPDGSTYPSGSKVVIPGENNTPIEVTIGDNGSGEVPNDKLPKKDVPGKGTVTEPNKKPSQPVDVTTPAQKTPTVDVEQDPKTGDVTVTPKKPDGSTFPPGTTVEIPGKDGKPIPVTIGEDGKGKVPNSDLPEGKVPGTGKITEPGKPAVEVPVTTPGKVTPATPTTETPSEIEITRKPNGDAVVTPKKPDGSTYPSGSKVVIPGENNTPIEVTIGDNGSGEVPNDKLPKKDVPGKGTVTEPNKKPSQPVDVTTPAQKTPTVDVEQDPKTGDVTVTPKKPDGSTFPPGTTVEIPGKDGKPIPVTIGEDGKGKVPNSDLPEGKVPGTGKITEPGKPAVEVPVTTPGKVTPATPTTETPSEIEITRKPNGDAVVTPKKPDGSTYPSGSKVVIPGENNTPIEVTIGDNGSGEVPNDKLPKKDVPGKGTVTEPNKKPSQPVDVTTPAQKTPTVDVEQDPKTGDVTVTPKKPDGSTFPPGTTVEIPGKDGKPIPVTIGEDGKGKVPNSDLPEGKVPGTGKITEPGKPAVEVPVTTPGKVIAENGELPGPITLPELTIEVRWIDEDGNVLKPSVKTGNEKNAEHGTIPGYEFVRTMIDENEPVMTHIFRKVGSNTNTIPVAPVTPAPSPTTPVPDAVTPNADQVDTKTTNDNGAKSNDSQNVLPNTGTESNAALASLGLLGMLGGLGLALGKKKED